MSNQTLAEEALAYARKTYTLKSDNKLHISDPVKQERRKEAEKAIKDLREDTYHWEEGAKGAQRIGAGNCTELAWVAYRFVIGRQGMAKVIRLTEPGDHVFVAVGMTNDDSPSPDMTQWRDDIYICDPWANIACPAKDYGDRFKAKMMKWENVGKQVRYNEEWVSPTDKGWQDSVVTCHKSFKTDFGLK